MLRFVFSTTSVCLVFGSCSFSCCVCFLLVFVHVVELNEFLLGEKAIEWRLRKMKTTVGVKPGATWWARDARRHWRQNWWRREPGFGPYNPDGRERGGDRKTNVLHSSGEYTPITEFSSRFDFDYTFQLESLTVTEKGVNYFWIWWN